jgi:hypothetical protein
MKPNIIITIIVITIIIIAMIVIIVVVSNKKNNNSSTSLQQNSTSLQQNSTSLQQNNTTMSSTLSSTIFKQSNTDISNNQIINNNNNSPEDDICNPYPSEESMQEYYRFLMRANIRAPTKAEQERNKCPNTKIYPPIGSTHIGCIHDLCNKNNEYYGSKCKENTFCNCDEMCKSNKCVDNKCL